LTGRRVSRRIALGLGAGAAAAAAAGGLALAVERGSADAGRSLVKNAGLALKPAPVAYPDPPQVESGRLVAGVFASQHAAAARTTPVDYEISYPPGAEPGDPLPVAVLLHGLGRSESTAFDATMAFNLYQAQAVAQGVPPFAIATVFGGAGWWHARADGTDTGAMVVDEYLPLLADRGLRAARTDRVALMGWSMGGYGALHLGGRLGPARVAAVAAMSPAIWPAYPQTATGAFDDRHDFERNGVFGRQASLDGIPVRIDCGTEDDLCAFDRLYVRGFARRPEGGWQRGEHVDGYWRSIAPAHLRFVGEALAASPHG
jgi:enterochelin esterase-like enzyme